MMYSNGYLSLADCTLYCLVNKRNRNLLLSQDLMRRLIDGYYVISRFYVNFQLPRVTYYFLLPPPLIATMNLVVAMIILAIILRTIIIPTIVTSVTIIAIIVIIAIIAVITIVTAIALLLRWWTIAFLMFASFTRWARCRWRWRRRWRYVWHLPCVGGRTCINEVSGRTSIN